MTETTQFQIGTPIRYSFENGDSIVGLVTREPFSMGAIGMFAEVTCTDGVVRIDRLAVLTDEKDRRTATDTFKKYMGLLSPGNDRAAGLYVEILRRDAELLGVKVIAVNLVRTYRPDGSALQCWRVEIDDPSRIEEVADGIAGSEHLNVEVAAVATGTCYI
jgi:hypothetical protein